MAKNISLLGADYPDVPAVVLPKTGGGSATFVDIDDVGSIRIPHKTIAWAGTMVSYEISRDGKLYRFTAMNPSGILCCAIIVMRSDTIQITNLTSNAVSQSYSSGVLTLTLPSNTYWECCMERLNSSHAVNS